VPINVATPSASSCAMAAAASGLAALELTQPFCSG